MAGHGSQRPEDKASHPGRQVSNPYPADFSMPKFAESLGIRRGVEATDEQKQTLRDVGSAYVMHRLGNLYIDSGRFNQEDHGGQAPLVEVPSGVEHGLYLEKFAKENPPNTGAAAPPPSPKKKTSHY
jgi:hypothetical protein